MKSPSSGKRLLDMQKQLGIRMRARRAAMLAENNINIPSKDEEEEEEDEKEEIEEIDEDSMDTTNESNDNHSEIISNAEKENVRTTKRRTRRNNSNFFRRIYQSMKRLINF